MKKMFLTTFLIFLAAFVLFFSFHKEKTADTDIHTVQLNKKNSATASIQQNESAAKAALKTTAPATEIKTEDSSKKQEAANAEFTSNEMINRFFSEVPRMKDLKLTSDEEAHETPQVVLKAGEFLADMRDYFSNNPQNRSVEMSFYLKCSQQNDFFESVRAICAARLSQQYFEATGHQISAELFDKRIDWLRRKIIL